MTIEEAIKHCEEVAEENIKQAKHCSIFGDKQVGLECVECAEEHRQLAAWLRELKESRMVLDILGQFLADMGTDICCEDLVMTDDYCENYCDNQKPLCWYRWAKLKASEVKADDELQ